MATCHSEFHQKIQMKQRAEGFNQLGPASNSSVFQLTCISIFRCIYVAAIAIEFRRACRE
ncbi:hypothetical protein PVAP13_3KG243600 [Panicum virgatum]|uniref:Uncharacterized protein n=1 Tax=Panicum virgatum TaxID=38727 RepID=A0A8T0V287_PANVG|nr:hypothetical protein PVAP13_3KG243600 [Panicum virgatum]